MEKFSSADHTDFYQIIAAKDFRLKAKVSSYTNGKMEKESNKREFERLPIDFVLEVYSEDAEGKKFNDKAVLKDVSGGGAKFLTKKSDMYFPGQLLKTIILLPGADEMEAHMKAKATVVRIDPSNDSGKNNKTREHYIAVKFIAHLNFERIGV